MPPKRRRETLQPSAETPTDEQTPDTTGMSQPAKRQKPTAASNADAIAVLGRQMSGVDDRLDNITQLLSAMATRGEPQQQAGGAAQPAVNVQTAQTATPAATPVNQPAVTADMPPPLATYLPSQMAGVVPQHAANPHQTQPAGLQPPAASIYNPVTFAQGQPVTTSQLRQRHFTTGNLPPAWTSSTAVSTGAPFTTAPPTGGLHLPTHQPWDQPTTLHDLEGDANLTRRMAVALQAAAAPFTTGIGKHASFPHQTVNRGSKKDKTGLGELTLPEYIWGFLQILKAKDPSDPDVPYMNHHLEMLVEDAKEFSWEMVRKWSEEVLSRISLGKLTWSNTYEIDRLQTRISHDTAGQITKSDYTKSEGGYKMADHVRRAKAGPPCRLFQTGTCSHNSDHITNGYRQLHVCAYCITNKCELHPHSQADCKTKKFNDDKKGKKGSGFGSSNKGQEN